ncbi:uncharacterized protein LOC129921675 isoform X4 [Biomphalaria glabrata]|uniref:Uncharacterized protein LOC129921675 isoform X4 n=1 Tax=Biomphalaria glabrata TaxID=6526 RepID=A0A9W2YBD0_BIOGL|nr:uncharacterized protein LOC129921675 isoform X4 [Biomphalaria glabrata]
MPVFLQLVLLTETPLVRSGLCFCNHKDIGDLTIALNVLADSEIYNSRLISACRNSPGFKIMSYVHIKKCLMYIDQRMQYMKAQEYCENFAYDCTLLISSTMIMHPMLCNANFQFFCEVR